MSNIIEKLKYVNTKRIDKTEAQYRMLIGLRSNGKTSACLETCLKDCIREGSQMAVIRRWDTDFKGGNSAKTCFDGLVARNVIYEATNYVWQGVKYFNGAWYFTRFDEELEKDVMSSRNITSINTAEVLNVLNDLKSNIYKRMLLSYL